MFRIHERRRNVEPESAQARRPDGREQRRLGLEPGSKIREPLPHEISTGGSVASHTCNYRALSQPVGHIRNDVGHYRDRA